ncbi:MAG: hypothetical protein ACRDCZ_04510 [Culicoidibacterales bacterium]
MIIKTVKVQIDTIDMLDGNVVIESHKNSGKPRQYFMPIRPLWLAIGMNDSKYNDVEFIQSHAATRRMVLARFKEMFEGKLCCLYLSSINKVRYLEVIE